MTECSTKGFEKKESGASFNRKTWRLSIEMLMDQQLSDGSQVIPQYDRRQKRDVLQEDIWLEIRFRWLHCIPLHEEQDFLNEKRGKLLEFMPKVERFHADNYRDKDPQVVIKTFLEEYYRFCSYFSSQRKMVEYLSTRITTSCFNRIGILQRWLRLSELLDICLQNIEFLMKNNKYYKDGVSLAAQSDEFFLHIRENEQLRICYQKYLEKDVRFLFPKLRRIYDSFKNEFSQMGLPLRESELLFLASSAPFFQIYGLNAHINYLQKFNFSQRIPERDSVVLFILQRMRTITEIRAEFIENNVMKWIPER